MEGGAFRGGAQASTKGWWVSASAGHSRRLHAMAVVQMDRAGHCEEKRGSVGGGGRDKTRVWMDDATLVAHELSKSACATPGLDWYRLPALSETVTLDDGWALSTAATLRPDGASTMVAKPRFESRTIRPALSITRGNLRVGNPNPKREERVRHQTPKVSGQ